MIVMPANNTGIWVGYLAGRFPGRIGHLFSPGAQRGPFGFMPYAIDNGVFAKGDAWEEEHFWARRRGVTDLQDKLNFTLKMAALVLVWCLVTVRSWFLPQHRLTLQITGISVAIIVISALVLVWGGFFD
jgi:hypothetical protein